MAGLDNRLVGLFFLDVVPGQMIMRQMVFRVGLKNRIQIRERGIGLVFPQQCPSRVNVCQGIRGIQS